MDIIKNLQIHYIFASECAFTFGYIVESKVEFFFGEPYYILVNILKAMV
jgi:hypothetical protein